MICPICGSQCEDGTKFCMSCGSDISAYTQPPTGVPGASAPNDYAAQQGAAGQAGAEGQPYLTEAEAKRLANADYKEAKRAYKQARKAAGKSSTPKVVAALVALLVVAGGAAGATWYLIGQGVVPNPVAGASTQASAAATDDDQDDADDEASDEASDEVSGKASAKDADADDAESDDEASAAAAERDQEVASKVEAAAKSSASASADDADADADAAADDADEPASSASSSKAPSVSGTGESDASEGSTPVVTSSGSLLADSYIGTWTGEVFSVESSTKRTCYGADGHQFRLEITSVKQTGQITASVEFLFHGHPLSTLEADVASSDGDALLRLDNLTGTLADGSFEFVADTSKHLENSKVVIGVETFNGSGEGRQLVVTFERRGEGDDGRITETYVLTKVS